MRPVKENNCGLTLTELVVATVLMGIVMLAVIAADVALRASYQTTSKDAEVTMHVAGMMLAITNKAAAATGMRTDPGIVIQPTGVGTSTYLFIRTDNNNPSSFADDFWVHYYWDDSADTIGYCDSASQPPDTGCTSATYLTLNNVESFTITFSPNENLRNLYLHIIISARYDTTKAYNLLNNPRSQLESKIIPLQHTW